MRVEFGPWTISGPEPAALAVEQRVARPFKREVLGHFVHGEPGTLEPRFEDRFLSLAFGMKEAA